MKRWDIDQPPSLAKLPLYRKALSLMRLFDWQNWIGVKANVLTKVEHCPNSLDDFWRGPSFFAANNDLYLEEI